MDQIDLPSPWRETPLLQSTVLSKLAGCKILVKYETLQPSGSFKSRGVGNYMVQQLRAKKAAGEDKVHFYSSSGGNAGLAAATTAAMLGHPCTVVVPMSTSAMMIKKIQAVGEAHVIQIGAFWVDADRHLREVLLPNDKQGVYVPPFDHEHIWQGNASLIHELHAQLDQEPTAVICSVGGGGLFCGVMQGLDQVRWSTTKAIAVETYGADSLHQSVLQGKHVTLPAITSLATTLGASRVAAKAYEYSQRDTVHSIALSDAEAAMACCKIADEERVLVELSCGVNAAVLYTGRLAECLGRPVQPLDVVVLILCGGSIVSLELLDQWRKLSTTLLAPL